MLSLAPETSKSRGEKRRRVPIVRDAARNVEHVDGYKLPSTKLQLQFKGASSTLENQEDIKEKASNVAMVFTAVAQSS